jgi:hypothetical protein
MNASRVKRVPFSSTSPPDMMLDIEQIEHRRSTNRDVEAIYFLSPDSHIVDCLLADLERRRYQGACLLWTSCKHIMDSPRLCGTLICGPSIEACFTRAN